MGSKPPYSRKTLRRIAPQPVQKVWAGRIPVAKGPLLVHEMMEQVAILADEPRRLPGYRRTSRRVRESDGSRSNRTSAPARFRDERRRRRRGRRSRASWRPGRPGCGRPRGRAGVGSRSKVAPACARGRGGVVGRPVVNDDQFVIGHGSSRGAAGGSARSRGPRCAREPRPRATASAARGSPDRRGHRP